MGFITGETWNSLTSQAKLFIVSFKLFSNEILGLVGESGCGKSTLGKTLVKIEEPTSGRILLNLDDESVDLNELNKKEFRKYKRYIRMLFQDPFTSLNPRLPVKNIISEPLDVHYNYSQKEKTDKIIDNYNEGCFFKNLTRRRQHPC